MNIRRWRQFDFSLGVQEATTWLLKKPNELARGTNLKFTEIVGGFQRRNGFQRVGDQFSTTAKKPTGGHTARFSSGSIRFVACNNNGDTATVVRTQDPVTGAWSTLPTISYPKDSIIFFKDHLDELYITGFDPATGDPVQPYNVDKTLDVSSTRNILNMPACYFLEEFLGLLYAGNVSIGPQRYKDRVYKSSPPLGAITFIQGDQVDSPAPVTLYDNVPTMTAASTPFGTAYASSQFDADRAPWCAFDDILESPVGRRWLTQVGSTTGWIAYDFGAGNAKTITYYSMIGAGSGEILDRAPKSWTFEGSNDNSSWTVLNTQTNVPGWAAGEKRLYSIQNTTAYRYYRINATANQGNSEFLNIEQLEFMTSTEGTKSLQFKIDSTKYIKSGMKLDFYKAGTEQKLYDITVLAVDKSKNIITIDPLIQTFAPSAVDTTNNLITISSTTAFPTGTPIKIDSSGNTPSPINSNNIYYIINLSATTFKLATSFSNAQVGNAIDITDQGSGNLRLKLSYVVSDNDEIWLDGRKGKLTMFWNTDHPTPEAADFLALKPGTDSSNILTAMAKSSNRLFMFTRNSGTRWDGQNLVVFNNQIGCISHRSIANIDDDWLIWVDSKGNVRARNETAGQQENISRPIRNRYMRKLTLDQLKAVSGAAFDNTYKLFLGTVNGAQTRVVYDFDANTWSPEELAYPALLTILDDTTGYLKPYFYSDNGRIYIDETGDLDDDKIIPMVGGTGRDMFGTEQIKKYTGMRIYTQDAIGAKIMAAVDGGQMKTIGKIDRPVCYFPFPERGESMLENGTSIDWQIVASLNGEPPKVEGATVYYTTEEDAPNERR